MWFSVCTALATGGGGGAGAVVVPLAVLSSAFRNVLMRRKAITTDFFINPPFARRARGRCGIIPSRAALDVSIRASVSSRLQFGPPTLHSPQRDLPQSFIGHGEDQFFYFIQFLQCSADIAPGSKDCYFASRAQPRKLCFLRNVRQPLFRQIDALAPVCLKDRGVAHQPLA